MIYFLKKKELLNKLLFKINYKKKKMKNCIICLDEKHSSEFVTYNCKCKEITCCAACIMSHIMEQSKKEHILNTVRCPCCNVGAFKISGNLLLEARAKEGLPEIYLFEERSVMNSNFAFVTMLIVIGGSIAVNVIGILNLNFSMQFSHAILDITERMLILLKDKL